MCAAGMEQLYSSGLECISIWVAPPNSQALIGRLERRGIRDKVIYIHSQIGAFPSKDRDSRVGRREEGSAQWNWWAENRLPEIALIAVCPQSDLFLIAVTTQQRLKVRTAWS